MWDSFSVFILFILYIKPPGLANRGESAAAGFRVHLFASLYPLCYTVYGFLRENEEINMKTIVVTLDKEHPDGEAILRAGEIIKAGGRVAFPTETVY